MGIPYRIFVERKTVNAPPWRVEFDDRHLDGFTFHIEGVCHSAHDPTQPKEHSVSGRAARIELVDGVIYVHGSE